MTETRSPQPEGRNPFDIAGRVVVITGGAGLLGASYARTLAAAGAHVVVADIDGDAAARVAAEAGEAGSISAMPVDVTVEQSVSDLASGVLARFGRVDALVNNAALDPKMDPTRAGQHTARFEDYPIAALRQQLEVDVVGAFLCARAFAPALAEGGSGVIVNVSSIYGMVGPDQRLYEEGVTKPAGYSISKAALHGLTRYLAAYYGPRLRVVTLTLGGVFNDHEAGFASRYAARTPIGRMAHAGEYDATLLYLISDAASYVTGSNVVVDGGWTAW